MADLDSLKSAWERAKVLSVLKRKEKAPVGKKLQICFYGIPKGISRLLACHTLIKLAELLLNTLSPSITCPFLLVLVPPPVLELALPIVEDPLM